MVWPVKRHDTARTVGHVQQGSVRSIGRNIRKSIFTELLQVPVSNMIESAKTSRKGGLSRTVRYVCIVYDFYNVKSFIPTL